MKLRKKKLNELQEMYFFMQNKCGFVFVSVFLFLKAFNIFLTVKNNKKK